MAAPRRCECPCHNEDRAAARIAVEAAQYHTAFQLAQQANRALGADTDDVIEAAVASGCECLNDHVPALQIKRIWGPAIREREPAESQADGGEGPE